MRIVEIGPNIKPVYEFSGVVARRIKSGSTYFGIDLDPAGTTTVRNDQVGHAVFGDIGIIPFRDSVADEIWLVNVFSGGIEDRIETLPSGIVVSTLRGMRYLKELNRILSAKGVINIGEWRTRAAGDIDWLKAFDFRKFGFTKQIYSKDAVIDFVQRYQWNFGTVNKPASCFFITLTKTV